METQYGVEHVVTWKQQELGGRIWHYQGSSTKQLKPLVSDCLFEETTKSLSW